MKKLALAAFLIAAFTVNSQGLELKVKVSGFEPGGRIPEQYAFCKPTATDKSAPGDNISPMISWDKGPEGTKSYALIVVDRDVPLKTEDMNKEDKKIPEEAPRQNFYHWMLINIPPDIVSIGEGQGKDKTSGDQLINDYLKFTGAKKDAMNMKKFSGYDGPCPPWNDERVHNYHFKVYALSDRFTSSDEYNGDDIMHKIAPYILAQGEVIGTYTLNPALLPKAPAPAAAATPAKKSK